jgi:Tat protein translocase TatB subunit
MALAVIFDSAGFGEWFILLAVILIVVGPKNLPSTVRKFGQYYSKFRRAAETFKRQLMDMDTEFNRAVNEATNEAKEAFTVDNDYTAPDGADGESQLRPDETGEYVNSPSEYGGAPAEEIANIAGVSAAEELKDGNQSS